MRFTNKKMEKTTIVRISVVVLILLFDMAVLPWVLRFPFFLTKDFVHAPSLWMEYGLIHSVKDVFSDERFRNLYLVMQLPVIALIIGVAWNVNRLKKKNRIMDGVGGPEPAGAGQHGTSRWQNTQEMDKTSTVWYTGTPLKKGGIIYGMEKSRNGQEKVWLNDDDVHTLLLGATRSGKDRKILMPSIWEIAKSGESMIVGDPKGENYIVAKTYLESQGYEVIALNLRDPLLGNQWNLLDLVNKAVDEGDIPKASEAAWDIAHTIVSQNGEARKGEAVWTNGEESTLAALMLLTSINSEFKFQRHMTTVYYLLAEYGQPVILPNGMEFVPLLDYISRLPIKHPAKAAFSVASIAPYKMRASFFTTALSSLKLFSDQNISDMTSTQDHTFENIGIDKTAVFLIIPDEKSTRDVLATLYIDQAYQSLVNLANHKGGRLPRRVNIILNEFGNLPAIPSFDKKITVAGGRGIRFTLAIQDVAQLKKLYGPNAQTITGNCHIWVYLKTADVETAKLISEKTGKYTVETENSSSSVQSRGHSMTHGAGLTGRPLLLPDEVLRWNINECLVLPIGQFPARYPLPDLSFWNANDELEFVKPSGDLDLDKELNRQIIEERWNSIPVRPIEESQIWLPRIFETGSKSKESGSTNFVKGEPRTIEDENINNEIATSHDIEEANTKAKDVEDFL
ncbi:MAG: VirD4-like conjugal transfer protein, CD1115 family [Clostridia bacterium]